MFGQWRAETLKEEGLFSSGLWAAHLSGSCSVGGFLLHWVASSARHHLPCQQLPASSQAAWQQRASSRHLLWPLSACGPQAPSRWSAETGHILRTCFPGTPSSVMPLSACLPLNTSPGISRAAFCGFQGMVPPMGSYLPEVMTQISARVALKELLQPPVSTAAPSNAFWVSALVETASFLVLRQTEITPYAS